MRLLGILAGVGIPHLRRPMPTIIVHLYSEANGGPDTRHSPLPLYQAPAVTLTLPHDTSGLESTRAVLHIASLHLWIASPKSKALPTLFHTTQITHSSLIKV